MAYFTKDFVKFFQELGENNRKEWFDANRGSYESEVKQPFRNLVGDLILAIQAFDTNIHIETKKAVFRINRDVRFSNNTQPYKTNVAAVISRFNKKEEYPCYYISINAEKLMIGGGLYALSKENLYKVRQEILYNENEFKAAINGKKFQTEFGGLKGDKNKILKPPFKEVAIDLPILYHKQFFFMKEYPLSLIYKESLVEEVAKALQTALPLQNFLREALIENPS